MKFLKLFLMILLLGISACTSTQSPAIPDPTLTPKIIPTFNPTATHTPELLEMSGPYLGQEPPGTEPKIFAPGIISSSDFTEFSGVFSPDGTEYYFYRYSPSTGSVLLFSKVVDGKWTVPEQLVVTTGYNAFEPYVTFDNTKLYFIWEHPLPEGQTVFPAYFFVERTEDGWSF